jgi:hypothetical protein
MAAWRGNLEAWRARFLQALGHAARRRVCPASGAGLIEGLSGISCGTAMIMG